MPRPTPRRLTLADLAILVAATASTFALWIEMIRSDQAYGALQSYPMGYRLGCLSAPFLLSMAVGLLLARLRRPRADLRRLARQPGTVAPAMYLASFGFDLTLSTGRFLLANLTGRPDYYPPTHISHIMICAVDGGEIVAGGWLALAVVSRWRAEPDWVDRSGRILGVLAVLASIVTLLFP